ncbi:MAG: tripartite tricarboxylate transporter substrate binding protein [Spirochaetota bacterium]
MRTRKEMKARSKAFLALCMVAVVATLVPVSAFAQDYPKKPIAAIVAFPAGGGTDMAARVILKAAEKYLKGNFVVDNKPGAGGAIGFTAIAQASKDGYTIGMINPPSILFNPIQLGDQVKYKLDDFAPIANFVSDPGAIMVAYESPFKTLKDVVAYGKANPDKLRIAYGGPGTSEALTLRKFEADNALKLLNVPFSGTATMLTGLLGGNADVMFANASEIMPQFAAKQIRVLAVGSDKRFTWMPEVPTYKESGFDASQVAMRGLAAPKGVDPKILKLLADAMKKTFEDPEFQAKAKEMNLPLDYLGPDDFMAKLKSLDVFYRAEYAKNPW